MIAKWTEDKKQNSVLLTKACRQLTEYFTQKRKTFNFPIRLNGTPFQLLAWEGLQQIPYGKTLSYADLARCIGRNKAARAVGNANHHNPLMIIFPAIELWQAMENWEDMQEEQPEKCGYWKKKRDITNCNDRSDDYII